MTGIVLSASENTCIVLDKNGIFHKFKAVKDISPGRRVIIPKRGIRPGSAFAYPLVSLAVASLFVFAGMISREGVSPATPHTPSQIVYLEDGGVIIEDESVPLAPIPAISGDSTEGLARTYICWACAGVFAVYAVAMHINGTRKIRSVPKEAI